MLDRLSFILGEAFQGMRRNVTMTIATVSTVAIALFLMGGIGLLYRQIDRFADDLTGRFEMRAFFEDGTKFDQIRSAAQKIREIDGVKTVQHIPRDKAWEREKTKYPKEITDGLENPLPDALKITLNDLEKSNAVVAAITRVERIDSQRGVEYLADEQKFVEQSRSLLRWLAVSLGGLLVLTSGILIYNATRLAAYSRRTEMRIMSLVGASRASIRVPYLIEGVTHGLLGGILATVLLLACQQALQNRILTFQAFSQLPPFPFTAVLQVLCLAGALYGMFCAYLAVIIPMRR